MELVALEKLTQPAHPVKFLTEKGLEKDEAVSIIEKLKQYLTENDKVLAISAPQLGIDARIFCIRFNDIIKTFINPVVTKKSSYAIKPETFESMPGKEILISRPEEVTVVYYTDEFKYEENKLLGSAARIFDQLNQLLDGILPSELGLVSDVKEDGSLADLTEDEIKEVMEVYKQFIAAKTEAYKKAVESDEHAKKAFRQLQFSEKVMNGQANIIAKDYSKEKAMALKSINQQKKANQRAHLMNFLNKKGRK